MQIQLIRNATLKIQYGGHTLLIDPDLANKHAREPLAGIANNPTAELPVPLEEVLEGIDAVLVSHLHQDHFDAVAQELLPKYLPLFCQPEDQAKIASSGFRDVLPVVDALEWQSNKIIRTPAQHGTGVWAERLAPVSGFVLQADSEPAVYWCGDTIL
ncbi:MAG: MBL fold metallo-hydrolase, partial [Anaerolineae bacterium]|nr:MBL fold metallo-hydrolase [Anaerolineae bacterium]